MRVHAHAAAVVLFGLSAVLLSGDAFAALDCTKLPALPAQTGATSIDDVLPVTAKRRSGLDAIDTASVEVAVARLQHAQCRAMAATTPAGGARGASGGSLRFNMTQNGKRMTADEFDAWMKANGVRVVKGNETAAAPPPPPPEPAKPPAKKKKR